MEKLSISIEQKAKAYDEALKKAKDMLSYKEVRREDMEYLFPELKESEDERIRKTLIDYFNTCHGDYYGELKRKDILVWLEKQGEQKPYGQRQECADCQFNYAGECKGSCATKRSEQNHIDKVEPKFKVGDWITDGYLYNKITDVLEDRYIVDTKFAKRSSIPFKFENYYHLWTIQDAKDGDVLAYVTDEEDLWIMIYWSLYEPYEGHVHYHALLVNDNFSDKGTCCICINDLKPATKEQRDLLFQKMKEAGYEWDTEKKELKKIEHAWSEEDEHRVKDTIYFLDTAKKHYASTVEIDACIAWLKSLKERIGG